MVLEVPIFIFIFVAVGVCCFFVVVFFGGVFFRGVCWGFLWLLVFLLLLFLCVCVWLLKYSFSSFLKKTNSKKFDEISYFQFYQHHKC